MECRSRGVHSMLACPGAGAPRYARRTRTGLGRTAGTAYPWHHRSRRAPPRLRRPTACSCWTRPTASERGGYTRRCGRGACPSQGPWPLAMPPLPRHAPSPRHAPCQARAQGRGWRHIGPQGSAHRLSRDEAKAGHRAAAALAHPSARGSRGQSRRDPTRRLPRKSEACGASAAYCLHPTLTPPSAQWLLAPCYLLISPAQVIDCVFSAVVAEGAALSKSAAGTTPP